MCWGRVGGEVRGPRRRRGGGDGSALGVSGGWRFREEGNERLGEEVGWEVGVRSRHYHCSHRHRHLRVRRAWVREGG